MRPRPTAFLTISMVVLIAACQAGSGSPGAADTPPAPASASAPPMSGAASPPEAGATIDPDWVTRPALTCGDQDRLFPPEALSGLGLAELGLDPAAEVLRSTISEAPDYYPGTGWHRVLETPDDVTFVAAGNAETPWFRVTVGLFDGSLQAVIQGQCHLGIAAPDGISFARWWLDPAAPLPTPGSTELTVLLRERECASGRPPEGRVLAPTIIASADAFQIAIGIRKQVTDQDCPGNPAFPATVVLPEPLGERGLFDASQFPPRAVTTEDPG
jgi:hypothetical protein